MRNPTRPLIWALVFVLSLFAGLAWSPGAYAEDDPIPQELFPDPTGDMKMFDAQGNQVDYNKLHKLTDPYHQSKLKGDFPIDGKHTYFVFTGIQDATSASTNANGFFDNVTTQFELFGGTTVFEPKRWDLVVTPVFNFNSLAGNGNAKADQNFQPGGGATAVNPKGGASFTAANQPIAGYQQAFAEVKLADLSPFFDFAGLQVGIQGIKNDFEGFIYNDQNYSANLFAQLNANEIQPNVFFADRAFKDVVSALNTNTFRNDQVAGGNYVLNDIKPGLDLNLIVAHNNDTQLNVIGLSQSALAKTNALASGNLNAGVNVTYLGAAVDGVLGRTDISSAFYYATGVDSNNFITGTPENVNAYMGFVKIDYPVNYWKPHMAFMIQSGDGNAQSGTASGWDSINDASNFFGGQFSFFEGQQIVATNGPLKGLFLTRANSVTPSFRNGNQPSNFVNPGLVAFNAGVDVQLHPKVALTTNFNTFAFQQNPNSIFQSIAAPGSLGNTNFGTNIGTEFNMGFFIRPGLADDFVINTGIAWFNFDPVLGTSLFGTNNTNQTMVLIRLTTTY